MGLIKNINILGGKSKEMIKLGSIRLNDSGGGGSVSATSIKGYKKLTVDDFFVILTGGYTEWTTEGRKYHFSVGKSYNAVTGSLSIWGGTLVGGSYINTDIYVLGNKSGGVLTNLVNTIKLHCNRRNEGVIYE